WRPQSSRSSSTTAWSASSPAPCVPLSWCATCCLRCTGGARRACWRASWASIDMTDAATLGIAAAIALGVWLVVLFVLAVATRAREPDPAPATMDLGGDESPAVVNLLTNGWAVGQEAVPATLLDLAARKVVSIE